ncbi:MAG TPA: zinc ribbon domain-containing protein, partial [Thermoleophilia bacterium]|nr:zinc ribbon domain-containing protein [Thermoleophilia bacterium]
GLGIVQRHSLHPWLVYKDQLYVVGGHLDPAVGFDLLRSSDGTNWEQVVEDGFGAGEHRNQGADLVEFNGRLYLATLNEDPRVLVPGNTMERFAPEGFQLWVSSDGSDWSQVGEDGFGRETSFMADIGIHGEAVYLEAIDYRMGSQIWKSTDGHGWEMIFHEPTRSFFNYGMGNYAFQGHYLWMSNDLEKGVDIWRSDKAIVAETSTTLAPDESGTSTAPGGSETTVATGGDDGSGAAGDEDTGTVEKDGEAAADQGLSGGILALIVVLALMAVTAIGVATYLWGRSRRVGGHDEATASAVASSSAPDFCSQCGSSLTPGSQYCPGCGRKL